MRVAATSEAAQCQGPLPDALLTFIPSLDRATPIRVLNVLSYLDTVLLYSSLGLSLSIDQYGNVKRGFAIISGIEKRERKKERKTT